MKKPAATTPMQRYRERLRADGLRPIQLWVPDTRSPAFRKEFRRRALEVAAHEARGSSERRTLEALLETQDTAGWEP